ncbi:hypothetical protein [Aureimonas pseudogalii]|uniref:DNA-binding protein n=1 Tax=Aureimonas pseudogalii TaxID=1744844 RepID=A0A7W6H695_9HYPH|nr:hypothetical protein [Aureimonas pseudogalii]MBB3999248.1 hypothetical protein [Aureimonas pseudogalii]
MSAATLNIRVSPRRMLSAAEAAEYVGVPLKHFGQDCNVKPVEISGRRLYDLRDLDDWIDLIKTGSSESDDDIIGKL